MWVNFLKFFTWFFILGLNTYTVSLLSCSFDIGVFYPSEMASSRESDNSLWEPFNLNNGQNLPAIGIGTFRNKERDAIFRMIDSALSVGYRSFDTAAIYGNEQHIGEALTKFMPKYDLVRDDIHVTTKLSNADHGSKQRVLAAFSKSEYNLGFAPDMYLINFLGSVKLNPADERKKAQRHSAWSAMAELYDTGRVDSIGVSNFSVLHLEQLLKEYHSDIPVVNQVEWHPFNHDDALLRYCNRNSIQLQGYHSLGGTGNASMLLKNPILKDIANDHSASAAQVLLTWSLQSGVAVIPMSINPVHIAENFNLNFTLTREEMQTINTLTPEPVKFPWNQKKLF